MEKIVVKVKAIGWIAIVIFTIIGFIQMLLTLNPRVIDLESRMAKTENKISMIEVKLDTLLQQSHDTQQDVKGIYHLMVNQKGE